MVLRSPALKLLHAAVPCAESAFPLALPEAGCQLTAQGRLVRNIFRDRPAKAASLSPSHSDLVHGPLAL